MMGISNDRLGTISCGRLGSNLDLRTPDTPTDFRRLLLLNGEADERIGIAVVNDELSRDQSSIAGVAPSVADVDQQSSVFSYGPPSAMFVPATDTSR